MAVSMHLLGYIIANLCAVLRNFKQILKQI